MLSGPRSSRRLGVLDGGAPVGFDRGTSWCLHVPTLAGSERWSQLYGSSLPVYVVPVVSPGLGSLRILVVVAVWGLAEAALAPASQAAPQGPPPTATCALAAPLASGTGGGRRVVLGTVSVPPARFGGRASPTSDSSPWRFFYKWGIAVRVGSPPVVISVPRTWRSRVAITWGGVPIVSELRLVSCSGPPGVWNVYPGGFYLRASSACVPLVFQVLHRSRTIEFDIRRQCSRPSG